MTIDEFADVIEKRIPTAVEFSDFVKSQPGWKIVRNSDGTGGLVCPNKRDPLAQGIAKMLSREPWRSDVLCLAENLPVVEINALENDGDNCPKEQAPPLMEPEGRQEILCELCIRKLIPNRIQCHQDNRPLRYAQIDPSGSQTRVESPQCPYLGTI